MKRLRDLGAKLTESDYERACDQRAIFKRFLEEYVFTEGTVMLLPSGDTDVSYRDEYSGFVTHIEILLEIC